MPGLETSQFWTPVLLCVAISCVFALLVLYYFRQQINTLDHKINSMFSLITSITNELNRLTMLQAEGGDNFEQTFENNIQPTQIEVSDEEYDDDEDDDDDDDENDEEDNENTDFLNKTVLLTTKDLVEQDYDDEEDDDSDSESDEEDSEVSIEDVNDDFDKLKIIGEEKSIHLGEEIVDHTQGNDDIKFVELEVDDLRDEELVDDIAELEEVDNLPLISDDSSFPNVETTEEPVNNSNKNIEIVDYKKLPVKTLREFVVEKGLVQNASKLSKKQLLELLEGN